MSCIHVSNPGNRPAMEMKKTSNREGFPKDVKLGNRADGLRDENRQPQMEKIGGRTLCPCKIWSRGHLFRPTHQSRDRKLQRRSLREELSLQPMHTQQWDWDARIKGSLSHPHVHIDNRRISGFAILDNAAPLVCHLVARIRVSLQDRIETKFAYLSN